MGHLGWLYKLNLHPRHQHCTDEAQKAETVPSAVSYIYIYISSVRLVDLYILLDDLVCSIVECFYESRCILASPWGESKYKRRVNISHDATH